ncbi:hypothetical protein WJX81_008391 [Elliptochloris bilobata]|uniref:Protein kinase domain-containing protein n=1 Tax=Elliptochloris bilobata TaxID=381761 RepID=A0AAW1SGU7_9CHLO
MGRESEREGMSALLTRCVAFVGRVKKAVAELRADVRACTLHREKCSRVLSASLAASLALEQVLYSGNLDASKEQHLQRLCADVAAAVDLANARVKVYGMQPRWKKYLKLPRQAATEAKFNEIIAALEALAEVAWRLQEGPNPSMRFSVARLSRPRRTSLQALPLLPVASDAGAGAAAPSSELPPVAGVRSLLYVPPQRSADSSAVLGQVWWSSGSPLLGRLQVHDLASGEMAEVAKARAMPAVTALALCPAGHVWTGHAGGYMRVWSEASRNPICPILRAFHSDVGCLCTDECGGAWVGSVAGNAKRVELAQIKQPGGGRTTRLQVGCTLRWPSGGGGLPLNWRSAGAGAGAPHFRFLHEQHSKSRSATPEREGSGGLGSDSRRAHLGPVTAVTAHTDRVWSSGGDAQSATLAEWGADGRGRAVFALGPLGVANAIVVIPQYLNVLEAPALAKSAALADPAPATVPASGGDAVRPTNGGVASAGVSLLGRGAPDDAKAEAGAAGGGSSALVAADSVGLGLGSAFGPARQLETWQLLTAHEAGQCQLWHDGGDGLRPVAIIGSRCIPARSVVVCEGMGLWAAAHADGSVLLRMLPAGHINERHTIALERDAPPVVIDDSEFCAPFTAHHSGLVCAAGGEVGVVTASARGTVVLWPEAELRGMSEAAGFVLPGADGDGAGGADGDELLVYGRPVTISDVLRRYFTPASAAMAEAALVQVVTGRSAECALTPVASGSPDGAAEQILTEVMGHLGRQTGDDVAPAVSCALSSLLSEHGSNPLPSGTGRRASNQSFGSRQPSSRRWSLSSAPGGFMESAMALGEGPLQAIEAARDAERFGAAPPPGDGGAVRSASTAVTLGQEELEEGVTRMPGGAVADAERDAEAESARAVERPRGGGNVGGGASCTSLAQWSSGGFMAESSANWIIDFQELTFKKLIGEGSIGRVHLGRWQETDVAIKVLTSLSNIAVSMANGSPTPRAAAAARTDLGDSYGDDAQATKRTLEREVNIVAAIRHPNVVLFMGVCLDPPCMVTEWCARGSLFDVLQKASKNPSLAPQLDWPRRLNIALDAAKGVLALHSHKPPILHRDLKSPNLLIDKHWRCKIADFNLSRIMDSPVVSSIAANNPRWLAPEVILHQRYSKAADVFSFAVVLWELAVWQLPWEDLGPFQIMCAISEKGERPEVPSEAPGALPGGTFPGFLAYCALMRRCWGEDPAARPSFEAIIAELRSLLADSSAHQRRTSGERMLKPPLLVPRLAVPEAGAGAPGDAADADVHRTGSLGGFTIVSSDASRDSLRQVAASGAAGLLTPASNNATSISGAGSPFAGSLVSSDQSDSGSLIEGGAATPSMPGQPEPAVGTVAGQAGGSGGGRSGSGGVAEKPATPASTAASPFQSAARLGSFGSGGLEADPAAGVAAQGPVLNPQQSKQAPWCGACHPDAADKPAGRAASARRSASVTHPLPPVDEAPSCEASATRTEEEAARCKGGTSSGAVGEGAPHEEGKTPNASLPNLARTASGGGGGSGSGSASSEERLRQLSPVYEATSSIERGSASETGGSDTSLAGRHSGHSFGHRLVGVNLPQAYSSDKSHR